VRACAMTDDGGGERIKVLLRRLTLPDDKHPPPERTQPYLITLVPCGVSVQLLQPKLAP
jgi:hypothetical protein